MKAVFLLAVFVSSISLHVQAAAGSNHCIYDETKKEMNCEGKDVISIQIYDQHGFLIAFPQGAGAGQESSAVYTFSDGTSQLVRVGK